MYLSLYLSLVWVPRSGVLKVKVKSKKNDKMAEKVPREITKTKSDKPNF